MKPTMKKAIRGTMQSVTGQERVNRMTPEELEKYLGKKKKRGANMGAEQGQGKGMEFALSQLLTQRSKNVFSGIGH